MSRTLKKTPAEIFHVGDNLVGAYNLGSEVAEYTFNQAVFLFGSALQEAIDSVEGTAKNQKARQKQEQEMRAKVLDNWLPKVSTAEPIAKPATQFADPAKRL